MSAPLDRRANRGQPLEGLLDQIHETYRARGVADIRHHDTRAVVHRRGAEIVGAHYVAPACADYTGCMGARHVVVEAKTTGGDRLAASAIRPQQREHLDRAHEWGCLAGLVVLWTSYGELWAVPWSVAREAMRPRHSLRWQPRSPWRVTGLDYLAVLVELERGGAA